MGLEAGSYISDLNNAWPLGNDKGYTLDEHIRLLKSILLLTFPALSGAMTATHTELNLMDGVTASTAEINYLTGVTSSLQTQLANIPVSGTRMVFHQTAAPTGWTKDATINDQTLRVVSGTVSSGGATAFSGVFGAGKVSGGHALSVAELAAHKHRLRGDAGGINGDSWGTGTAGAYSNPAMRQQAGTGWYSFGAAESGQDFMEDTGSGTAHTHTLGLDLQYQDVIIAVKD